MKDYRTPQSRRSRLITFLKVLGAVTAVNSGADASQVSGPTITTRELAEVVSFSDAAFSPDRELAIVRLERPNVVLNDVQLEWWLINLQTGEAQNLGNAGVASWDDTILESAEPVWAPDSTAFFYRRFDGHQMSVWRVNVATGESSKVSSARGDAENLRLSRDGRYLTYNDVRWDLPNELIERERLNGVVWSSLGMYRERSLFDSRQFRGKRVTVRGNKKIRSETPSVGRRIDVETLTDQVGLPQKLSSAAKVKVVRSAGTQEPLAVHDGPRVYRCSHPVCTASDAKWVSALVLKSGREVVLFREQAHNREMSIWRWRRDREEIRPVAQGGWFGVGDWRVPQPCADDGERLLLCVTASPNEPPRLESIDLQSGERKVQLDANAALRTVTSRIRVEYMEWEDPAGARRSSHLVYPVGVRSKSYPLVLTGYVCSGFLMGGRFKTTPEFLLAQHGIASLCVEGRGARTEGLKGAQSYDYEVAAWRNAIKVASAKLPIDSTKVGVAGFSYSAEVTSVTLFKTDLFAAAMIAGTGNLDPLQYHIIGVTPTILKELLGLPPPTLEPEAWWKVSPALNADRIKAPLLIQVSDKEMRSSLALYTSLRDRRKPVELIAYPNEGHGFIQPHHIASAFERGVDWFRFWLKGEEDGNPEKREQYQRWRLMRETNRLGETFG